MSANDRALVPAVLPPMHLEAPPRRRSRGPSVLPQMTRILCVLVALALPSLGITLADGLGRSEAAGRTPNLVSILRPGEARLSQTEPRAPATGGTPRTRLSSLHAQ